MKVYGFVFILSALLAQSIVLQGAQIRKKVLILGAGLSGLTAGIHLLDNGINDFLILEGQDYIGGRIKQVPFGGYKVETGANWIHFALEEDTAPIWKLKNDNNVKGIWSNYDDIIIRNETGANVTDMNEYHKFSVGIQAKLESVQEARKRMKFPDIPGRVGLSLMHWRNKNAVDTVIEYHLTDFEYGKKVEQVSFRQMFEGGKDFFVTDQRGMFNMYKDIYKRFEGKIMTNKTVKKVEYQDQGVQVHTSDGEVYTADFALCTFSTGVLASDMVEFKPPLPDWKREAIYKMPLSGFTKIFLRFPRKFWDSHEYILLASERRGFYPIFQDLERPGIFPVGSGILMITVTGDESERIEKQTTKQTKSEITAMLRGVYGSNVTEPLEIYYRRWTQNPYTRGAYSEAVVGTSSKDIRNLNKNLNTLYFSGAALEEEHYATMQGAYITGKEKGQLLVKIIKCKDAGGKNCASTKPSASSRLAMSLYLFIFTAVMSLMYICM